jgi:hypothetical protein
MIRGGQGINVLKPSHNSKEMLSLTEKRQLLFNIGYPYTDNDLSSKDKVE